jgi:hypothetical protein
VLRTYSIIKQEYQDIGTLLTIRDNIPVEKILQSYMEESEEVEVLNMQAEQAEKAQQAPPNNSTLNPDNSTSNVPVDLSVNPLLTDNKLENYAKDFKNELSNLNTSNTSNTNNTNNTSNSSLEKLKINFQDTDIVIKEDGVHSEVVAPKDLKTLQQLADERKIKEQNEKIYDNDSDKISLGSLVELNLDVIEL